MERQNRKQSMTALLDTSFLFALANRSDRSHTRLLTIAQTIIETLVSTVILPDVCARTLTSVTAAIGTIM